jgi:hypothetical protein
MPNRNRRLHRRSLGRRFERLLSSLSLNCRAFDTRGTILTICGGLLFGTLVDGSLAVVSAIAGLTIAKSAFGEFLTRHTGVLAAKLTGESCHDAFAICFSSISRRYSRSGSSTSCRLYVASTVRPCCG